MPPSNPCGACIPLKGASRGLKCGQHSPQIMNNPSEASKDTIPRETLVRVFWLEPYMIFVGLVATRLDRDQWYSLHRQRRCRVGAWAPNAAPPPFSLYPSVALFP